MRKLLIMGVAALCLTMPLSACNGTFPPQTNASATLKDEKALLVAEAAYAGARTLLEAAVDAGQVKGTRATEARRLNQQAYAALQAARTAQAAAQANVMTTQANLAIDLIAQIQALIRKRE